MKYKIFDYAWHISHQFDMLNALKNDCDFYCCVSMKTEWDLTKRPKPDNLNLVTYYEENVYDCAILHIDQTCIVQTPKRMIYEQFNTLIQDIPKIVLNHGTPVYPEAYVQMNYSSEVCQTKCVEAVKKLVGNNIMVVNSHAAASEKEWGFGYSIVHGLNPNEWLDMPKEPRVFTALSPFGLDTYYNRNCLIEVSKTLHDKYGYPLAYANINVNTGSSPAAYKNYLGSSLLYLDTSFRTPMNRARTEAFLSGCCVLQVEGAHDLELWARDRENIILVPDDPSIIADTIAYYLEGGYLEAIEIGKKAKEMATREFSPERYRLNWMTLLKEVMSKEGSAISKLI